MTVNLSPFASERAIYVANRPRNKMLELAKDYKDVLSLGRGDPDLSTPSHIIEAAHRAAIDGETHYTSMLGIPPLRQAISEKMRRENVVDFCPDDEIMVTTGAQEAIHVTMTALLNPGDEVIIPCPSYATYDLATTLAGGKVVSVPLHPERGFQLDASC